MSKKMSVEIEPIWNEYMFRKGLNYKYWTLLNNNESNITFFVKVEKIRAFLHFVSW